MNPVRLLGLSLLVAAISCGDAAGPEPRTTDLEAAHQRWRAHDLHTYAFTVQRSCFCANVHRLYVAVLSDTVAGVLDLDTGQQVERQLGETVEGLFTFIQNAIDRRVERIDVSYDAAQGFPTEIDYDGSAQVADDEIVYRVSDVHTLAVPSRIQDRSNRGNASSTRDGNQGTKQLPSRHLSGLEPMHHPIENLFHMTPG